MHDLIFQGQDQWNGEATSRPKGVFKGYAETIGLDVGKWEQCFDDQKFLRNIQSHRAEAERIWKLLRMPASRPCSATK